MINDIVQEETKPIIVPMVLLPVFNEEARVGKSPSLFGVAMAPTCPFNVAYRACLIDILSICDIAYFHLIASEKMFRGINAIQIIR